MTKNRIRELRKNSGLSQENFALELGTTQQAISRMETGFCDIPIDLLAKMAKYFNVTTDYIIGITEIKRDLSGQMRMNSELDKHYDIVLRYQRLTEINKKTLNTLLERLEQAQRET
ncbi:MAG: helix-turn-helix transcriptional regulator [Anaerocolumna sp.]